MLRRNVDVVVDLESGSGVVRQFQCFKQRNSRKFREPVKATSRNFLKVNQLEYINVEKTAPEEIYWVVLQLTGTLRDTSGGPRDYKTDGSVNELQPMFRKKLQEVI